jgi:hypothetical protein
MREPRQQERHEERSDQENVDADWARTLTFAAAAL